MIEAILTGRPSVVESNWKSTAQTLFGCVGFRGVRCGAGAEAFAAPPDRDPQALFAPDPLQLLVIDDPALGRGRRDRPGGNPTADDRWRSREATARSAASGSAGVLGLGLVALGCSVLPGHAAGEPFTHTHHRDEVVHGCPPACRAQKFSLGDLLQRGLLQLGVGQQPLQRGVLPLEVLQPFGVIGLQPAELVAPPVVGLLGHPELPADIGDVLALAQHPIRLRQFPHDLLRRVPLPRRHPHRAFLPGCRAIRLSLRLDQPAGSCQLRDAEPAIDLLCDRLRRLRLWTLRYQGGRNPYNVNTSSNVKTHYWYGFGDARVRWSDRAECARRELEPIQRPVPPHDPRHPPIRKVEDDHQASASRICDPRIRPVDSFLRLAMVARQRFERRSGRSDGHSLRLLPARRRKGGEVRALVWDNFRWRNCNGRDSRRYCHRDCVPHHRGPLI